MELCCPPSGNSAIHSAKDNRSKLTRDLITLRRDNLLTEQRILLGCLTQGYKKLAVHFFGVLFCFGHLFFFWGGGGEKGRMTLISWF